MVPTPDSPSPAAAPRRPGSLAGLLLEAGRAFLERKEWEHARASAEQILSRGEELTPAERREGIELRARASAQLEDAATAEAAWRDLLEDQERAQDTLGMAETWVEIGLVRKRDDKLGAAGEAFAESLRCSSSGQPGKERAAALAELGVVERLLGKTLDSLRHLEESLRIYEALGSPHDEVRALKRLANAKQRAGRLAEAEAEYERALALLRDLDDPIQLAILYNNVAGIRNALGDQQGAIEKSEAARDLFLRLGEQRQAAVTLGNLGMLRALRGENGPARRDLEQSLALLEALGEERSRGTVLNNLSLVDYTAGRYTEALAWADASIESRNRSGERGAIAKPKINRARALLGLGQLDAARTAIDEASNAAEDFGSKEEIAEARLTRAELAVRRQAHAEVIEAAAQVRQLVGSELPRLRAEALRLEARARAGTGNVELARNLLLESEELSARLDDPYHRALCGLDLGKIFLRTQSYEAAADRLRGSLELLTRLENVPGQVECLLSLGEAERWLEPQEAERRLEEAGRLADSVGTPDLYRRVDEARRAWELWSRRSPGIPAPWLAALRDLARAVHREREASGLGAFLGDDGLAGWLGMRLELPFVVVEDREGRPLSGPAGDTSWQEIWKSYRDLHPTIPPTVRPRLIVDRGVNLIRLPLEQPEGAVWVSGGRDLSAWTQEPFASFLVAFSALLPAFLPEGEATRHGSEEREFEGIVYSSRAMAQVVRTIEQVAATDAAVLIRGESGTGKELVARAVHRKSNRPGAFVAINCASVPRELIESELFGAEKGAYTGADRTRPGQVERADGGTLFLDEIGDMEPAVQTKLLRFLEEREFFRVGGREPICVDVRLVAATSRDLDAMVQSGTFRTDLLHRIMVVPIFVPPLRERPVDVPALLRRFAAERSARGGRQREFDAEATRVLAAQAWPGNVRELRNVVHRIFALSDRERLGIEEIPEEYRRSRPSSSGDRGRSEIGAGSAYRNTTLEAAPLRDGETLAARMMQIEGRLLRRALEEVGWNQSQAARRLGIKESTIRDKIRKYGIRKPAKGKRGPA